MVQLNVALVILFKIDTASFICVAVCVIELILVNKLLIYAPVNEEIPFTFSSKVSIYCPVWVD